MTKGVQPSRPEPRLSQSGGQGDRAAFLTVALTAGIVVMLVYSAVDLLVPGHLKDMVADLVTAVVYIGGLAALRRGHSVTAISWVVSLTTAVVCYTTVLDHPAAEATVVWAAVFPPSVMFLLGWRGAVVLISLFVTVLMATLWSYHLAGDPPGFSLVTIANTVGAVAVSTLFAFLYERSRAESTDALRRAADTDPLTGLSNRRAFLRQFEREAARARRDGALLSLLLIDVDHFKAINDSRGHECGDEALTHLAGLLMRNVRKSDLVGRLGGEEFGVLLADTNLRTACPIAEKLRRLVAQEPLSCRCETFHFTISIGVAEMESPEDDFRSLFSRADRAMYLAKESGRNRVATPEAVWGEALRLAAEPAP